jgi:asparagine N-glycosylation enzyme membrane subunit Stt3
MEEVDWKKLMGSKRLKQFSLLLAIFLIGFATRYITKNQLFFDPDSYWWYQLAMYFAGIDDGRLQYFHKVGGQTIYELAYYPTGRVLEKELLLLPFTIGFSYKILGIFGAPQTAEGLLNYMFFFGPFFGALTAVLAYFLGRELTGSEKAGFVAAVFYSFAHFAMTRNTAGDTGQESLGTFFLFLMLYLFITSVKQRELKLNAGYAVASGVVFLLAANTWGGTSFYWGLIASSVFAYLAYNVALNRPLEEYRSVCVAFPLLIFTGVFMPSLAGVGRSYVIGSIGVHNVFQNLSYIIVLICLFLIGYEELRKKREVSLQPRFVFLGAIAVVALAIFVSGKFIVFERIFDFIHRLVFAPEEKGLTGKTVAYYRPTSFPEFKATFGLLLLAIPAGFLLIGYDFYKRRDFTSIFMIFFMILGIIAYRWMIRLSFFLAFILPLFIAYMFARYIDRQKPPQKKKKDSEGRSTYRLNIVAGFLILLFILSPTVVKSVQLLKGEKYADQSVIPWKLAGEWLKQNTPEGALLIHWWDYGYHLQTFAIRRTIVDGGNTGPPVEGGSSHRNIDVAKAFVYPEEEFYRYIKPYNPENRPIYVLMSIEEIGKSGAITYHSGVTKQLVELWRKYGIISERRYREIMDKKLYENPIGSIIMQTQQGIQVLPEFRNATMVEMLFFPEELERFELVYTVNVNMGGRIVPYVRIYKYKQEIGGA